MTAEYGGLGAALGTALILAILYLAASLAALNRRRRSRRP